MLNQVKAYIIGMVLLSLFTYYTYTQYVITSQERAIHTLEVSGKLKDATAEVKAVEATADKVKEVYDAVKDVKVDVNYSTGSHTIKL